MNIQQLNQNGQNIWVFFVTVIVALLVTGGSWSLSRKVHKALSWYEKVAARSAAKDEEKNQREYDFPLRVAMLTWLVHNGYTGWMWTTGAWLAILIDSKVESKNAIFTTPERKFIHYTACDYVWAKSSSDSRHLAHGQWSPLSE